MLQPAWQPTSRTGGRQRRRRARAQIVQCPRLQFKTTRCMMSYAVCMPLALTSTLPRCAFFVSVTVCVSTCVRTFAVKRRTLIKILSALLVHARLPWMSPLPTSAPLGSAGVVAASQPGGLTSDPKRLASPSAPKFSLTLLLCRGGRRANGFCLQRSATLQNSLCCPQHVVASVRGGCLRGLARVRPLGEFHPH
jgi:hypothetical protein